MVLAALDRVVYVHEDICLEATVFADVVDALLRVVSAATQKDTQVIAGAAHKMRLWRTPCQHQPASWGGAAARQVITLPRAITPAPTPVDGAPASNGPAAVAAAAVVNTASEAPAASAPLQPLPMAGEDDLQTPEKRALRALDLLWHLFDRARASFGPCAPPPATAAAPRDFFIGYWLPILTGLSANSSHPIRSIRLRALHLLQRLLIVPELAQLPPAELAVCFNEVLFPLLEDLLLPEPFQRDLRSAEETRLRAASLLCKLFLQSLDSLRHWPEFAFVWLRILDFVHKYMQADNSETLVRPGRPAPGMVAGRGAC